MSEGSPASAKYRTSNDQDSPDDLHAAAISKGGPGSAKRVKNDQNSTNDFHASLDESRLLLARPKDELAQFANNVRQALAFTEMAPFNQILNQIQNMNNCMGLLAWIYERHGVRLNEYKADTMLHKSTDLGTAVLTSVNGERNLLATLCSKLRIESDGDAQNMISKQKMVEERVDKLISMRNQICPESTSDPQLINHKGTSQMKSRNRKDLDSRIESLLTAESQARVYRRRTEEMLDSFIGQCGFATLTVSGDFDGKWKEVLKIFSLFDRKARMFNEVAALLGLDAKWDTLDLQPARDVYGPRIAGLTTTHTLFRQVAALLFQIPEQEINVSHCGQIIAQTTQVVAAAEATYQSLLQNNVDLVGDNQAKGEVMDRMEKTASDRAAAELRQAPSPERAGTKKVSLACTEEGG